MTAQNEEQNLTEVQATSAKPRFTIEKLEERLAPAKGGLKGPPDGHTPGCNYHHYDYRRCGGR